jgi:hypothetical protein
MANQVSTFTEENTKLREKKHPAGYTAPVKIAGTYDHPSFGLDLLDSDDKREIAKSGRNRK